MYRWVHPGQVEPRIHRLSEGGVEGVEQRDFTTRDPVEGQGPRGPVKVNSYSIRAGWGRYNLIRASVQGPVTVFGAAQTPGDVIPAQPAVRTFPLPANPSVGHSYGAPPAPLCLPVAPTLQPFLTQHLSLEIEPVRMIGVWLLGPTCCLPVPLWQRQIYVCGVWVQGQFVDIWWVKYKKISYLCSSLKNQKKITVLWLLTFLWTRQDPRFTTLLHTNETHRRWNVFLTFKYLKSHF